ncbi:MAG: indole-3-glycerol phosphate synthase, partial [Bacteroidetes bacterium RBG_19FT_COMBO_42_7]
MNLLDKIIANKKKELAELIGLKPVKELERNEFFTRSIIPLTESILSPGKTGIIAEFKRKSPSQGILNNQVDIGIVTTGYAREGASGLSVLTDHEFFGGDINDLMLVRKLNSIPVLRKDFIIDEYQVIESKAAGADVILLIAAIIPENQILKLARLARSIGLQVLMEVHNVTEIQMVNEYVDIIGVNNRDLRTFKIDTKL